MGRPLKDDSQINFVKTILREDGYISKEECLVKGISRLGAIIWYLKKQGYKFKSGYPNNMQGDYVYRLLNKRIK